MKVASWFLGAETHMPNGEEKLGVSSNQGKRLKVSKVPPNAHCFIKTAKLDSQTPCLLVVGVCMHATILESSPLAQNVSKPMTQKSPSAQGHEEAGQNMSITGPSVEREASLGEE